MTDSGWKRRILHERTGHEYPVWVKVIDGVVHIRTTPPPIDDEAIEARYHFKRNQKTMDELNAAIKERMGQLRWYHIVVGFIIVFSLAALTGRL